MLPEGQGKGKMIGAQPSLHQATLCVSTDRVSLGHSATLTWKVIGVAAAVDSIHLASGSEDGTHMIESTARFLGVKALHDVSIQQFEAQEDELEEIKRHKAKQ
jgi:hypothetical protein